MTRNRKIILGFYLILVGYLIFNTYTLSRDLNILKSFNSIELGGVRLAGPSNSGSTSLGICNEKGECVNMIDELTQPIVEIYHFEIIATALGAWVIISEWRSKGKT